MHIACWIPKATNIPTEYVITIVFFTATMVAGTPLNIRLFVYCLSYMKYSFVFIEMCLKIWKVVVDVVELGADLSYFTNPLQ
jgi:hypothetical protein